MNTNSKKNYWDSKPYWCQPWSIIGFGVLVIAFSWELFDNIAFTLIIDFFIFIWWIVFLILAPNSYQVINDKEQQ